MVNDRFIRLLGVIILVCFSGCTPLSLTESAPDATPLLEPTANTWVAVSQTPSLTPLPSVTPSQSLSADEGPLLLIQTGFYEYQYLNPISQKSYPFQPPISDPQFRLRANLSPSGTQMFFPLDESTGIIIDLRTGETILNYEHHSPALFDPELAAAVARPFVTELNLTEEGLLEAVNQAYQRSKSIIRWYLSDRYHLSVQDTSEISTNLFLDDHQTGTRLKLEDQPWLVNDYRVSPEGNQILLKKGLVLIPGVWQNDRYYLVNVQEQTSQLIPLPNDVENPSVTWFSENAIGVIHHSSITGGSGFSILDTETMESLQIIYGDFHHFLHFGEHLFVIRSDTESQITIIELITMQGELVSTQSIDRNCFFQFDVSERIVLNCDLDSFVVDTNLNIEPFGDGILTLTPAPDGRKFVMVNRSEQSYLLDADLRVQSELPLEDTPIEIQWLPDSSGFLYRTRGKLYRYDLKSETSHLLIESDIFSDYTNINAVWVQLD